jgi:hypothetical protein
MPLLSEAMSVVEARPRLDTVAVARLPVESEVTISVGPVCAVLLAADVMPAIVYVLAVVPNDC